jgi:hypothetical protein
MENISAVFPRHGKNGPDFSTRWKTIFHAMEKTPFDPSRKPPARGLKSRGGFVFCLYIRAGQVDSIHTYK